MSVEEVLLRLRRLDLAPLISPLAEAPKMRVAVYGLNGESVGEVELPLHFLEPVRLDLIRRAYLSALSARFQPKGVSPEAGKSHSCQSFGVGLGIARIPRYKGHLWPRGCFAPNTVGGRRAHPPRVEKKLREEINKRERRLALRSAIAATAYPSLVKARGHVIDGVEQLPIVVAGDAEKLARTEDVKRLLKALRLWQDVERAARGVRVRAGVGKMRGRRYKEPKSLLVVASSDEAPLIKAARNLSGVDAVGVRRLSVLYLAPGGVPGRLTLWTAPAIEELRRLFL
ncbi:MAG: 50S ribosomal protein L4 [Thermoproteus sp. AZ2]|uniref:50S ribosomal protein L4 n=1 Tax=Thermoproteus sp. AZ2 TaxID=1609232 RepID=A0ACC6V120_9CREN